MADTTSPIFNSAAVIASSSRSSLVSRLSKSESERPIAGPTRSFSRARTVTSANSLGGLIGYRALGVSYVQGSGIDTNGVDAVLHGPLIGFNLRF